MTKKRWLIVILAVAAVFTLAFGLTACGEDKSDEDEDEQLLPDDEEGTYTPGLEYKEITENGKVVAYSVSGIGDATDSEIIIPSVHSGKLVTAIGEEAFYECKNLTGVTIPDSVTQISDRAFVLCYGLTSVTFGDKVTAIGDEAFYGCGNLTGLVIPDSVTSIGRAAFYACISLTSVTMGNSVASIGEMAFYRCEKLKSVTLGNSVANIDEYAFGMCKSLTDVHFGGTKAQWEAIEKGSDWDFRIDEYTVHCKDGDIEINNLV